jgi:SAM-dependent methyltransferase/uncharacterized protein YbaR (Trm112 family)
MRTEFIETLHCPYSGSRFDLNAAVQVDGSTIEYGLVTSEAGDFPIIDGILRLKVDEYRTPLVDMIKNGRREQALVTAMEAPFLDGFGTAITLLDRTAHRFGPSRIGKWTSTLKIPMCRVITAADGTLAQTLSRLRVGSWGAWQLQRFSMPHFLPTYPLLHLVKGGGNVLDFGCGLGHASFLISRRMENPQITCADIRFHCLYLARKFFLGNGNFVCLNGDYLLPFDSKYFSLILSSDTVHFIDSKLSLIHEFCRTSSDRGIILLPHLHNRLSPVVQPRSLTPHGYRRLFTDLKTRILGEEAVINEFVSSDMLDLETERGPEALRPAIKGVCVVATRDDSIFRRYVALWQTYADCIRNPHVNPAYEIRGISGDWILRKRLGALGAAKLPGVQGAHLPDTAVLPSAGLDQPSIIAMKNSSPSIFNDLVRQFVIIDVPDRFN